MQPKEMVLTGVPDDQVEAVVEDFNSEGADKVIKERQPDGNWTVRANFIQIASVPTKR